MTNPATLIPDSTWKRLARLAKLPRDSWSDAWVLIHGAAEGLQSISESLILVYMRQVSGINRKLATANQ